VAFGTGAAHAQEASGGDMAAAEALFAEGRKLSAAGGFAEACARFEASMSLVPRLGVQLNLADCYERVGRTASAWVMFGEAAALARRIDDPRESFARQRQDALTPRLSRLRISVAQEGIEGFSLTRDGVRVAPLVYGVEVPVDPGVHQIEATAPEHLPWSSRVVVSREGDVVAVVVPVLETEPRPPAAPDVAPATRDALEDRRRATPLVWISAGIGVVGIGAGAALGLAARSLSREARPDCDPSNNCTDAAYALIRRSRRDGNLATLAFGIGGAALATSIVLYYVRDSHEPPRSGLHLVPAITSSVAGAAVGGVFW
jgi:serine/threonine-protein kinase